jgi:hypothetical protein
MRQQILRDLGAKLFIVVTEGYFDFFCIIYCRKDLEYVLISNLI